MTFDEYFDKYIGKGIDYDGQFGVQCFTADHYILMDNKTYKAIQDIEVGDRVIGYDNKVNTVTKVFKRNADVLKVHTNIGTLCVTEDHPFYYMDGSFDNITAAETKRLALYDDRLYTPTGLTQNELLFLGFWLGDGCLGRHNDNRNDEIKITYGKTKVEFVESLGIVTNIHHHSEAFGSFNAGIKKKEHKLLTEIIYSCYNSKKEKILPLIFTPQEYRYIIAGYCKADGSCKNNSCVITSTSKSLLLSIQAAAILCGYDTKSIRSMKARKYPVYIKNKKVENPKPMWRLTLSIRSEKKHKQIKKIENIGEQEVYNIETDGSHTYICDNYKVHNCFDLANDYSVKVVGGKAFIGMGAYEIYTNFNNQPGHNLYERIPNTPEFVPQKGDIMVWGTGIGQYGHVAICTGEGDTTWFNSFDQNWTYAYAPVTLVRHSYNSVLGVLRPKDQKKVLGIVKGDANGDGKIDVSDIATISSHIKGIKAIDEKIFFAADVNSDGKIDVSDIAKVASHIKGIKPIK